MKSHPGQARHSQMTSTRTHDAGDAGRSWIIGFGNDYPTYVWHKPSYFSLSTWTSAMGDLIWVGVVLGLGWLLWFLWVAGTLGALECCFQGVWGCCACSPSLARLFIPASNPLLPRFHVQTGRDIGPWSSKKTGENKFLQRGQCVLHI